MEENRDFPFGRFAIFLLVVLVGTAVYKVKEHQKAYGLPTQKMSEIECFKETCSSIKAECFIRIRSDDPVEVVFYDKKASLQIRIHSTDLKKYSEMRIEGFETNYLKWVVYPGAQGWKRYKEEYENPHPKK